MNTIKELADKINEVGAKKVMGVTVGAVALVGLAVMLAKRYK